MVAGLGPQAPQHPWELRVTWLKNEYGIEALGAHLWQTRPKVGQPISWYGPAPCNANQKGTLHGNAGARYKSRLGAPVNAIK
jgi:hypothetical protein